MHQDWRSWAPLLYGIAAGPVSAEEGEGICGLLLCRAQGPLLGDSGNTLLLHAPFGA